MSASNLSDSHFDSFWRGLPKSVRGEWRDEYLGRNQSERFRDEDIVVAQDFVQQKELDLLVALIQSCEGFFSTGPTGGTHAEDRIRQVVAIERDFAEMPKLIDSICLDMRHIGGKDGTYELERRFLRSDAVPLVNENADIVASRWVLFLNDDYTGGELVFPTRRCIATPGAGSVVRWPLGIPYGIVPPSDGYQFTLGGTWR